MGDKVKFIANVLLQIDHIPPLAQCPREDLSVEYGGHTQQKILVFSHLQSKVMSTIVIEV